jgi:methylmalonyl-CoA/ethylmalonyl-CoA epimerase
VVTLHHYGIVVADLAAGRRTYLGAGASPVGDTYADPIQKAHICFLQMPGNPSLIELIAPYADDAPVANFLERYGGGLHHACYMTVELEATVERFRHAGALPVFGPQPAVAFGDRPIIFLYGRDRSLLELVETAPGETALDILADPGYEGRELRVHRA